MNDIIKRVNLRIGYATYQELPRSSTSLAMKHFKGKKIKVIEVGVAGGINANSILKSLNVEKIYLVDNYINTKEYPEATEWRNMAKKMLKGYTNIAWIEEDSIKAVEKELFLEKQVDFVYIDGSHHFENVLKDIKAYYPLVKDGGIIAGHDITFHKGVSDAIIKFCYEYGLSPTFKHDDWIIEKQATKNFK